MAYQVTRKNRIREELQLCRADGTVAESVFVDLNVDEIAARVQKAYEVLGAAQSALQKAPESQQLVEAYGNAVIAVFRVIFGDEGTDKIMTFYENNYSEMLLDLFPFINDVVMPQIRSASESRRQQLVEAARLANKGKKRGWRR